LIIKLMGYMKYHLKLLMLHKYVGGLSSFLQQGKINKQ